MDDEMRRCFTGPMPVEEFFRKFLPSQKLSEKDRAALPGFERIAKVKKEKKIYDEFVLITNSYCSKIRAYNSSKDPSIESDEKYKPDIVFYDTDEGLLEGHITPFQCMELFVGFKRGSASNPSADTDNSEPFEKRFDTTYGQMALYSTRMQMYQFRTCVFSVGIFGKIARLFRWDRAGAIVSEPIKYSAVGNRELTEFFYRFDLMSRTQRGWDQTVHDANAEETAAFTQAIQAIAGGGNAVLLKSLLESVGEPDDYPRKKVNITYGAGQRKSYIVGHSLMVPESPTGRATRGFVAMDAKTRKLVFLKDTWRPNVDGVKSEDRWYKRVKGGRNIAPLLHGSDVGYAKKRGKVRLQRTITQNYPKRFCSIQKITGYIHYRTVQPELYVPLEMFKDSKNLTQVMYDAILAIQDLYNRGILHKDISTANIMITMDGRGRLIDFDLAGEVGYSGAGRIGTLRFISIQLLDTEGKVHELSDDLESHFFVLLFEGLRFVEHNSPSGIFPQDIFDQADGNLWVGWESLYSSRKFTLMNKQLKFTSKPFTTLIRGLYRLFKSLYLCYIQKMREVEPDPSDTRNVEKLEGCVGVVELFEEALRSEEWPAECDKVQDQYHQTTYGCCRPLGWNDAVALSHFESRVTGPWWEAKEGDLRVGQHL